MSSLNKLLTPTQRIQRIHSWMMSSPTWAWIAAVCMVGKVKIEELPTRTAGTDGVDVYYDPRFMADCNEKQLRFVVIHENMHKALMHMVIHQNLVRFYERTFGLKQARMLVNVAQDFGINRDIMKHGGDKVEMPPVPACYDEKYDDDSIWDTSAIAADIAKNAKKGGGGGKGGKGGSGGDKDDGAGGIPDSFDDHQWDDDGDGDGQGKAKAAKTKEQIEQIKGQIEDALRQGQALSRKLSGSTPRSVEALLEPAVRWQDVLRQFLTERIKGRDNVTYKRPNRRFMSAGVYMPTTYSETVDIIGVYVDTSGSIGPAELQEVLSELKGLFESVRPAEVHIAYWDTDVAAFEKYEGEAVASIIETTKPAGGGGTQPSCVPAYYEKHGIKKPTIAVWMSDGFVGGDWAESLGVPAFWVIASNGATPSHLPHVQLPKR